MDKSGFLRRSILICGIAYLFLYCFLSDNSTIGDAHILNFAGVMIVVIAAWGIITLLAKRL